tara:strand:+ start:482 stop:1291 length:810 start_codon:yes stop_codon:yes gene_type:complete
MNIRGILRDINRIATNNSIDKVYLVGGIPRDYSIEPGELKTTDIDITTNTSDITRLAILYADKFKNRFKLFDQGNVKVFLPTTTIDFSSNYISENVSNYLKSEECTEYICPAFPDINKGMLEPFSRDFTINTLHLDIDDMSIYDPTESGIKDLNNKILKTPVPAEITISDDPRRIHRAIYFSSKYGFSIHSDIINYVKNNNEILNDERIKESFVTSKISQAIFFNPENTLSILREMNMLGSIPLVGEFKDFVLKNKLTLEYLNEEKKYR